MSLWRLFNSAGSYYYARMTLKPAKIQNVPTLTKMPIKNDSKAIVFYWQVFAAEKGSLKDIVFSDP